MCLNKAYMIQQSKNTGAYVKQYSLKCSNIAYCQYLRNCNEVPITMGK